ncbi:hypothetical protein EDC04DRAFT_2717411 [Pisolithus marmoratus]|nr:hypothetical protein EDC04DRAFT_2717411 [Pisolithus marmoratus]
MNMSYILSRHWSVLLLCHSHLLLQSLQYNLQVVSLRFSLILLALRTIACYSPIQAAVSHNACSLYVIRKFYAIHC